MDTLEKLARQAAETINGGEYCDGKWYTEGQRQAWRKAMTPAAEEIERLRQKNAELLSALKTVDRYNDSPVNYDSYINKIVEAAIAKATGGE